MAAMETAAPVIRTINIKANSRKRLSVDPVVLARKLEAAKREQEAANNRRERRRATRNGTFVRSTTHSSDSSSTPPVSQFNAASSPMTKNLSTCNPPPAAQPKDWSTADGRPVMTHKSMLAALNLSLADLEAMTEKLEHETTKQREYLCSRCRTPDTPGQHAQHNHHHNQDSPSRNYSRRRSFPAAAQFVAVAHGSQTAYERVDIPEDDPPQYHAISYRASEDVPRITGNNQRPQLQPHDRPDWTQQSQYGGNTATRATLFDVPSGYIFKRRNPQTTTASEVAPARKSHVPKAAPPKEMHLISDAVKLIKAKERRAKGKSIVDFFKKF